jgi:hypothetical protein
VDLRKLLHQVETAPTGSRELDSEFENTFPSVPPYVTRSIDAAARLLGKDPDLGLRPEHLRLIQDPKWGKLFDSGFHCDRAALAILAVFLEAKIALTFVQPEASANKVIRSNK